MSPLGTRSRVTARTRVEATLNMPVCTIRVGDTDIRAGDGGTVTVGPCARVGSGSGTAIRTDARAGDWTVVLERDTHGLAGHVEGGIPNPAVTAFRVRACEEDAAMALLVGDRVDMCGRTAGVLDAVHRTRRATVTGGHKVREVPETRFYHDRAQVYEALPSVLRDMARMFPVERLRR